MRIQPLPDDPSGPDIIELHDLTDEDWWMLAEGELGTFVCQTLNRDGTGGDTLLALEMPVRLNHHSDLKTERVLLSIEDAAQLAGFIVHSLRWLRARGIAGN